MSWQRRSINLPCMISAFSTFFPNVCPQVLHLSYFLFFFLLSAGSGVRCSNLISLYVHVHTRFRISLVISSWGLVLVSSTDYPQVP